MSIIRRSEKRPFPQGNVEEQRSYMPSKANVLEKSGGRIKPATSRGVDDREGVTGLKTCTSGWGREFSKKVVRKRGGR